MSRKKPRVRKREGRKEDEKLLLVEKTNLKQSDDREKEESVYGTLFVFLLVCICTTLMLLGLLQSYGSLWGVTTEKSWVGGMLMVAVVAAGVICVGERFRIVPLVAVIALLVEGWSIRWSLLEGLKVFANPVLRSWSEYYGTTLGQYRVDVQAQADIAIWYLAFCIAFVFAWAMVRIGNRLLLLLPAVAMLIMELLVGLNPSVASCVLLLAGIVPAIAYGGNGSFHMTVAQMRTGVRNSVLVFAILLLGYLGFQLTENGISKLAYARHNSLQAYQNRLEKKLADTLDELEGGFAWFFDGNDEDGTVNNRSPKYTGKEIFRVTVAEKPQTKFYFRGFVGNTYENGQWSPIDEQTFLKKAGEWAPGMQEPGRNILDMSYEYGVRLLLLSENRSRSVDMELLYTDECKTMAYLPYYTNLYAAELANYTVEGDGIIRKSQDVSHIPVYTIGMFAEDVAPDVDDFEIIPYEMELQEAYAKDVLKTYTKVPKSGVDRILALADRWAAQGYAADSLDINYAIPIQKVTSELAERTEYNMELKRVPQEEDVLEYFLFDSKEGFCIHYASTATLLLRQLGVPARYVTGYAIDPEDFEKNPDGTYTAVVQDEKGHAWTEVFFREQGWIPVEVTKGATSMGYGCDYNSLRDALTMRQMLDRLPKEEKEEPASQQQQQQPVRPEAGTQQRQPETEHAGETQEQQRNTGMFLPLVILLFVAVAVLLFWKRKELDRKRRFYSMDTTKALPAVSHEIYRLLKQAEIVKEKEIPDEDYIETAVQELQFLREGEMREFMSVVQRTMFSDYIPTQKEVRAGRKVYYKIAEAIRNKAL